jgi:hypothetical protein
LGIRIRCVWVFSVGMLETMVLTATGHNGSHAASEFID